MQIKMKRNKIYLILLIISLSTNLYFGYVLIKEKSLSMRKEYFKEELLDVSENGYALSRMRLELEPLEALPYAIFCADEKSDGLACYEVYDILKTMYKERDMDMPKHSRAVALSYLRRGANLGDEFCKDVLYRFGE